MATGRVDWLQKYMIPEAAAGKKYGKQAVENMRREQFSDAVINAANARFGYSFAKGAQGMVDPNARGNWLTQYFGDRGGFGIEPYNYVKSLGHTTQEIRDALPDSGLKPGGLLHQQILSDLKDEATAPGTRIGQEALSNTAKGLVSPQGSTHGTGGTSAAFGRRKKTTPEAIALMINPIT